MNLSMNKKSYSENMFEAILESSPDAMVISDREGIIQIVARVVERPDDGVDRRLLVVEGHGHGVLVHVGFHGLDVELLDGRTGLRGGSASDDSRRLKDVSGTRCMSGPCKGQDKTQGEDGFPQHRVPSMIRTHRVPDYAPAAR